jgi:uncharacterized membrane protein
METAKVKQPGAVRQPATVREFDVELSRKSLGYNLPQRIGHRLWLPMLLMAAMAFPVAVVLGIVRADEISSAGDPDTIAALKDVGAGVTAIAFASVFGAISFAIARILGQFRKGGGDLQEAAGRRVETLRMPLTAKLFIAVMAMAMMTLVGEAVLHFAFAADVENTQSSLALAEERATVLSGVRTAGIATYLAAIGLGLASIIQVLRFQSVRVRELADEKPVIG